MAHRRARATRARRSALPRGSAASAGSAPATINASESFNTASGSGGTRTASVSAQRTAITWTPSCPRGSSARSERPTHAGGIAISWIEWPSPSGR
jgi:hypothetical protein